MIRAVLAAALLLLQAALPPAAAQAPPAAPQFRSGVDVVRVDVLVTSNGRSLTGLTADDFELRDSGVPQRLESVTSGDVPVSMMLALDTSTSVEGPVLARLKAASRVALEALAPADRAALLTFSEAVQVRAAWTTDRARMREAIEGVRAGGATSLHDAAFAALTLRDEEPGQRALVVLFSDGADTSSWLPGRAVLDTALRTDAVVYAVGTAALSGRLEFRSGVELLAPPAPRREPVPFVTELAEITGGTMMPWSGRTDLAATFETIVNQFRTRYVLTYTPQGVDRRGWHPIDVRVKRRNAQVTARRGYSR